MGLFSEIQYDVQCESRQARNQAEQSTKTQETQPQTAPEPAPEISVQPQQMAPPPFPESEPQEETTQSKQATSTIAEAEATTPVPPVSEPEPAPAVKQMSDAEAVAASTKRIQTEIENITRKSMKECVAEHLAGLCAKDPLFAHKVIQPGKALVDCFNYINEKARKFAEQERKDNGITEQGVYGCAIPTDLVYQWAEDYFTTPVEKKPERKAPTKAATPTKTNRTPAKSTESAKVPPTPAGAAFEQMTLI